MTRCTAVRMDDALPDLLSAGSGTVHSVYRSSVNLQMKNGMLCTLLDPTDDLGPNGIVLAAAVGFMDPELGLRRGARVLADRGTVRAGMLIVDLTGAARISCMVTPGGRMPGMEALHSGAARLDMLLQRRPAFAEGSALQGMFDERTRSLQAAALQTPEQLMGAAERLIGLGMGLTPSGDDFLTGCLAALWYAAGAEHPAVPALRQALAGADGLTTDVGRAMLSAAEAGRFRTSLLALIEELFRPAADIEDSEWEKKAERVACYGASSGWDMLSGVSAGCRILLAQEQNTMMEEG